MNVQSKIISYKMFQKDGLRFMSMNKFLVNSFESIPMDIALLEFTVKN